jgi:hypothetical protein
VRAARGGSCSISAWSRSFSVRSKSRSYASAYFSRLRRGGPRGGLARQAVDFLRLPGVRLRLLPFTTRWEEGDERILTGFSCSPNALRGILRNKLSIRPMNPVNRLSITLVNRRALNERSYV